MLYAPAYTACSAIFHHNKTFGLFAVSGHFSAAKNAQLNQVHGFSLRESLDKASDWEPFLSWLFVQVVEKVIQDASALIREQALPGIKSRGRIAQGLDHGKVQETMQS